MGMNYTLQTGGYVGLPYFSKFVETLCKKGLLGRMTNDAVETCRLLKYLATHFCTVPYNRAVQIPKQKQISDSVLNQGQSIRKVPLMKHGINPNFFDIQLFPLICKPALLFTIQMCNNPFHSLFFLGLKNNFANQFIW